MVAAGRKEMMIDRRQTPITVKLDTATLFHTEDSDTPSRSHSPLLDTDTKADTLRVDTTSNIMIRRQLPRHMAIMNSSSDRMITTSATNNVKTPPTIHTTSMSAKSVHPKIKRNNKSCSSDETSFTASITHSTSSLSSSSSCIVMASPSSLPSLPPAPAGAAAAASSASHVASSSSTRQPAASTSWWSQGMTRSRRSLMDDGDDDDDVDESDDNLGNHHRSSHFYQDSSTRGEEEEMLERNAMLLSGSHDIASTSASSIRRMGGKRKAMSMRNLTSDEDDGDGDGDDHCDINSTQEPNERGSVSFKRASQHMTLSSLQTQSSTSSSSSKVTHHVGVPPRRCQSMYPEFASIRSSQSAAAAFAVHSGTTAGMGRRPKTMYQQEQESIGVFVTSTPLLPTTTTTTTTIKPAEEPIAAAAPPPPMLLWSESLMDNNKPSFGRKMMKDESPWTSKEEEEEEELLLAGGEYDETTATMTPPPDLPKFHRKTIRDGADLAISMEAFRESLQESEEAAAWRRAY